MEWPKDWWNFEWQVKKWSNQTQSTFLGQTEDKKYIFWQEDKELHICHTRSLPKKNSNYRNRRMVKMRQIKLRKIWKPLDAWVPGWLWVFIWSFQLFHRNSYPKNHLQHSRCFSLKSNESQKESNILDIQKIRHLGMW